MVQRNSQAAQLGAVSSPQIQQSGAGFAQPDADAFSETRSVSNALNSIGSNSTEMVLGNLLQVAGKLAEQQVAQSREEAYLAGSAAVGQIDSEAELEGSILTRGWAKAGFRDTTGRLAAADMQAQIAEDMHKMREKSPEEFSQYLAEKRGTVLQSFEGMTLDTRKTLFAQQMMNDRAAIKKHQSEHYKFVVEAEQRSVSTANFTAMSALDQSKGDEGVYGTATDAAFMTGYSSIVQNPKLPTEIKGKLVGELAERALAENHIPMFLKMQRESITLPDGTKGAMMSIVPIDDQVKLSGMLREAKNRTSALANTQFQMDMGAMQADWANTSTPAMPKVVLEGMIRQGVQNGSIKEGEVQTLTKEWAVAMAKKSQVSGSASAFSTGDSNALLSLGKTVEEGANDWMATVASKMDTQSAASTLLTIGLTTGQEIAFKKAGQILAPGFTNIGLSGSIDAGQAAGMAKVLQMLDGAKSEGKEGAYQQFLSAFAPEAQDRILAIRDKRRRGIDPAVAIAQATTEQIENNKLDPSVRAAMAAVKSKEIAEAASEVTSRGMFGTAWLNVKSIVPFGGIGTRAQAELALRPSEDFFEGSEIRDNMNANGQRQLAMKMSEISRNQPHLSIDSVKDKALADIGSRTIPTKHAPFIIPDGMSPSRFFGTDVQVPTDRIASALDETIKPKHGGRMVFGVSPQGQITATEYNEKSAVLSSAIYDPKVLRPIIAEQQARMGQEYNENMGDGVTKKQGNLSVTFNGANTANIEPSWMKGMRSDLVDVEGIRDVPYADGSGGRSAVGVGVNSINAAYPKVGPDGKVSPADINSSFAKASDASARVANLAMLAAQVNSEPAFRLFGVMAYQSGTALNSGGHYKAMIEAIRGGDKPAAFASLQKTKAWEVSDANRRKYYTQQFNKTME